MSDIRTYWFLYAKERLRQVYTVHETAGGRCAFASKKWGIVSIYIDKNQVIAGDKLFNSVPKFLEEFFFSKYEVVHYKTLEEKYPQVKVKADISFYNNLSVHQGYELEKISKHIYNLQNRG